MRGFGPMSDLRDGFRIEEIRARDGTKADKPFFHVHFAERDGEGKKLSRGATGSTSPTAATGR